jgi:hypothetical protein
VCVCECLCKDIFSLTLYYGRNAKIEEKQKKKKKRIVKKTKRQQCRSEKKKEGNNYSFSIDINFPEMSPVVVVIVFVFVVMREMIAAVCSSKSNDILQ